MKTTRHGWTIEPHVCVACLGRILSRTVQHNGLDTPQREYRCSNCGITGIGQARSICCCGAKFNTGRVIGIRCIENPAKGPASPSEIVAAEN